MLQWHVGMKQPVWFFITVVRHTELNKNHGWLMYGEIA